MTKAILSVVWQHHWFKAKIFDKEVKKWIGEVLPLETPGFIKSGGGGNTPDLQMAQVFGWSPRAKERLRVYRAQTSLYEVIPIILVRAIT